jgi:hypothetical protein
VEQSKRYNNRKELEIVCSKNNNTPLSIKNLMSRISSRNIKKLYEILSDEGVDLKLFEINNTNEHIWKIIYRPFLFYFTIVSRENDYQVKRYYSDKRLIPPFVTKNFKDVLQEFENWVVDVWDDIKTEIDFEEPNEEFSKLIKNISPDFDKIYNQSLKSEMLGLDEICGFGYRKSLEYLMKDYLIYKSPEEEHQTIREHQSIVKCMKEYPKIIDENILKTSERGFWLGNDHSHYYKKHENLKVEDLKKLIDLTIRWIENKEETDHYTTLIQGK